MQGKPRTCHSALISDRHILTSYDCIATLKIQVFKRSKDNKNVGNSLPVKKLLKLKGQQYNVAVLELVTPVVFDNNTSPVCIPALNFVTNTRLPAILATYVDPTIYRDTRGIFESVQINKDLYNLAKLTGMDLNSTYHLTTYRSFSGPCPFNVDFGRDRSTQLYSLPNGSSGPVYSIGTLQTDVCYRFCGKFTESSLYDDLHFYGNFFKQITKDAKTCPSK